MTDRDDHLDVLRAVPLRHPGRAVAAVVVGLVFLLFLSSLLAAPNLDIPTITQYLFAPVTISGVIQTLILTVLAMVIGTVGGVLIAVARLSENVVLSFTAGRFVWFFRGTPVLVQIIFWGYLGALFPRLVLGIPLTDITFWSAKTGEVITPFLAAMLALGLNEAAYASEIVRGGILAVDRGQTEAAWSLGYTPAQTLRRIVLPQAMRVVVPPMGNEVITMLKTTALVSVIAGQDLMTNMQRVYSQNYKVIPLLVVASIWYLVLTSIFSIPQGWLERRYARADARSRTPGTLERLIGRRPGPRTAPGTPPGGGR